MGTSRLALFNRALSHLGHRALATETENVEARRLLDREYVEALKFCLQRGFWNFAITTIEVSRETAVTPLFGYAGCFAKPADWLRTYGLYADEFCQSPADYRDEGGFWHADPEPVFVRYISIDRGSDLAQWPASFAEAFSMYLAGAVCERLTQSDSKGDRIAKATQRAMSHALSMDAMDEPPQRPPLSAWTRARMGSYGRDRR